MIKQYFLAMSSIAFVWGSVFTIEALRPVTVVPRVLDGSIEKDVHRVHTNRHTGKTAIDSYKKNLSAVTMYCNQWHDSLAWRAFQWMKTDSVPECTLTSRYSRDTR